MHGIEDGLSMPWVMGFARSRYAQIPTAPAEQWWLDAKPISLMKSPLLSLSDSGVGNHTVGAPPPLV